MNHENLSEAEIDVLLKRGGDVVEESPMLDHYFSLLDRDTIGEIGNISFGSSATALSTLLNEKVEITTPHVSLILSESLADEFPQPYVAVEVIYTEGLKGSNLLFIEPSDAKVIARLMLREDGTSSLEEPLSEIQISALQEAMNQMMGSSATAMSTVFKKRIDISPPSIGIMDLPKGAGREILPQGDMLVKVSFRLTIGHVLDSNIMQVLPLNFARGMVDELMEHSWEQTENIHGAVGDLGRKNRNGGDDSMSEQQTPTGNLHSAYNQAMTETAAAAGYYSGINSMINIDDRVQHSPDVQVQPVEFSSFTPERPLAGQEVNNLDMLLDIPLQVTVELGRTIRSVKEILSLSSGSIIELDKLAGEPVDILVNKRLIAKGEVVVIDENFGVRVTDIISQSDRLKKLK